jgi:hypothetical protein
MEVIATFAVEGKTAHLAYVSHGFCTASRSSGARPLRWQQATPQQIQIRQRKGGIQPHGILRQPAVANLAKAPQALDHVEDMLDSRPRGGAPTVDKPLIFAQRPASAAPVDSVADAGGQRSLAMRLIPVRLVAEHFSLFSVQQFGHLRAVVHIRCGGAQAMYDAEPVSADVRFHPKVPVLTFLGLAHVRIARALLILGRRGSGNDGRIHDRTALEQQPFLFEQASDLGKDLLSDLVLLQKVAKSQDRRLVGNLVSERFDAGAAAHRLDVVQSVLGLWVGESILHKVNAQHLLHWLPLRAVTRPRVVLLDQRQQSGPRNHGVHLGQKALAPRDLALLLPGNRGKRRLLHRSIRSTAAAHCTQYRLFRGTCAELP